MATNSVYGLRNSAIQIQGKPGFVERSMLGGQSAYLFGSDD
jgi:hypothetical protein